MVICDPNGVVRREEKEGDATTNDFMIWRGGATLSHIDHMIAMLYTIGALVCIIAAV